MTIGTLKSPFVRRDRLGLVFLSGLIAAMCLVWPPSGHAAEARRPNVIIIFADDQGSVDLHCMGTKDIRTPNLDALAKRGVLFTQFYAAAPVCSPSRAGLMTGRYPVRAGVPGNVPSHKGGAGMPNQQVTIAEIMKDAGYATAHIGKWHLGYTPETMPNAQGFDYSFGHMGGCIDNYSHFFYWQGPNRHDLWRQGQEVYEDGRYFPALMVQEASAFIEKNRDKPFFIYYALNTPHYPYQGHADWLEKYKDLGHPRNLYNAFVSTQDHYIGELLAKVDELGLRDDTIVIFQSDHGHSTEERAHHGGGSAGPYRGAKFSLFEGGIRVPAIISWPGKLPQGKVTDKVAHSCDWLATIAALCDVKLGERDIDGVSLAGMIQSDEPSPHEGRALHWTIGNSWAVRQGDWKLIGNPRDTSNKAPLGKDDKLFLVNLAADVSEMRNLAQAHPDWVTRLEKLHEAWFATARDQ